MSIVNLVTAAAIAAVPLAAISQTSTQRIDQRQANQQQRIDKGVKSGQLTPKEAERLQKGQARVQKMENKAMADGKVTKREAKAIERAQDRQSRRIEHERHDKQRVKK